MHPLNVLLTCRVLELLSRFVGSHPEAQLLYARTLYLNGSMDAAARKAANILGSNHSSTQAALLVVSIHLRQGRPADAMAALEAAVSANFSIREAPVYHVLHAQVLMANGQLEEARKVSQGHGQQSLLDASHMGRNKQRSIVLCRHMLV